MIGRKRQKKYWWIVGIGLLALVVTYIVRQYQSMSQNQPAMIVGTWYFDDLRTEAVEGSLVTFSSFGDFDGDAAFGCRWKYRDGKIYFRNWRLKNDSRLSIFLTNSLLYSWVAETEEYPLSVDFNDDQTVMTLTAEGSGPRGVLRRAPAELQVPTAFHP